MRLNTRLLLLVLLLPLPAFAQYRAAVSSAGGTAASSSYALRFTLGEPVPGVAAASASYTMTTGYIVPPAEGADVTAPSIMPPSLPQSVAEAQPLAVEVEVTDPGSGLATVTLFYRRGGDPDFGRTTMTNTSGATYTATIPADSITSRGAEFYVTAVDQSANTARYPAPQAAEPYSPVPVTIGAPGRTSTLRQGREQSDYRLISVPMDLDEKASSNVLADLGPYDNTRWRLWALKSDYFDFEGEAQFDELSSGALFEPGAAFFILSAEGGTFRTGAAQSLSTVAPFTKSLHRGWNFVGNPFDFSIPVGAISLSDGTPPNVQGFAGGWTSANALQPFQGYLIDAGTGETPVTLRIDPDLSAGKSAGKSDPLLPSAPASPAPPALPAWTWSLRIDAQGESYFDVNNRVAVGPEASREWDALDRPEPPVLGDYVSVYFPHREWGLVHRQFEVDARPEPVYGDTWDFEVATGSRRPVTLTFHGLDEVPPQYAVHLVDRQTGHTRDVRAHPAYTVVPPGAGNALPLRLLIGASAYVQDQVNDLDLLPDRFELDQNYPNPFNPSTSIRYGLAEAAVVTLRVYNALGQVVAVLVDGEMKEAGYHVVHWDARGDDGSAAASGLYLYRLRLSPSGAGGTEAGERVLTRKMLLVK